MWRKMERGRRTGGGGELVEMGGLIQGKKSR